MNKPILDVLLAKEIAMLIMNNITNLRNSNNFINHFVHDNKHQKLTPLITLQSIPNGNYSNSYGINNIFFNYDFDNVFFANEGIENEAKTIFERKNNGKAQI